MLNAPSERIPAAKSAVYSDGLDATKTAAKGGPTVLKYCLVHYTPFASQ